MGGLCTGSVCFLRRWVGRSLRLEVTEGVGKDDVEVMGAGSRRLLLRVGLEGGVVEEEAGCRCSSRC